VNQTGINLHQTSPGIEFFLCIFRPTDASDSNNGERALRTPVQVSNYFS
jgi:hypothetical protein